jgi:drug/metabolite transporter (DMT)-like permease
MPAVLLALATAIGYSGSDYAAGLAGRRASVVRVTVLVEVANTALLMSVVPFVSRQAPSLLSMAWGAVAGVGGVVGAMALYAGFRRASFSVASSVSAVSSAAFSALAGLLLGERPGALSLAGIVLALPAIAAVSASSGQPGAGLSGGSDAATASAGQDDARDPAGRPRRGVTGHAAGVVWGLIAGAGFGLLFISLNLAGSETDLWPLAAAGLAGVVAVICIAAFTGQLGLPPAGSRWLSVLSGITAAAATFAYFLATHRGLLAVTGVIASLYPAGTILLARILLGERLSFVRMVGLCLAAASVGLIAAAGASPPSPAVSTSITAVSRSRREAGLTASSESSPILKRTIRMEVLSGSDYPLGSQCNPNR